MQCQMCDKAATVHLTEIVNGKKTERHLCEACAQKEGIAIKAPAPISELLTSLMSAQAEAQELGGLRCEQCGLSWLEFRKGGLLGCPNDYTAFEKPLRGLLERVQEGATRHLGRVPRRCSESAAGKQVRLLRLRQDLRQAVEAEDYERAARLRDEMRLLS